jgi:hypothetical protein
MEREAREVSKRRNYERMKKCEISVRLNEQVENKLRK